jgi:hypothetical protein
MYFAKIDLLRYPDMTTALQTCYVNADWHTFFLEAIAFHCSNIRVISFKGLLSQWAIAN